MNNEVKMNGLFASGVHINCPIMLANDLCPLEKILLGLLHTATFCSVTLPAIRDISDYLGVKIRRTRSIMQSLETKGYLTREYDQNNQITYIKTDVNPNNLTNNSLDKWLNHD